MITDLQQRVIDRIVAAAKDKACGDVSKAEIKELTIKSLGDESKPSTLSVVVVAGYQGDENDMRSLLCRTRGHFFVGRRGGVRAAYSSLQERRDQRKVTATKKYPLIFGFTRG